MREKQKTMAGLEHFDDWSVHLYQLFDNPPSLYLSDTSQRDLVRLNPGREVLDCKQNLRKALPREFLVEEFGLIESGRFIPFSEQYPDLESLSGIPLVVKSVNTSNGDNVFFIGGPDSVPHEFACDVLLNQSANKTLLVTRWVFNATYASDIWPHGSNTIRFLTYCSTSRGPAIASSVHKWANLNTGPVDNWNKGGFTTSVTNGIMMDTMEDFTPFKQRGSRGSRREPMYPREAIRHRFHLDSGKDIFGVRVPYWRQAEELVLEAAEILYTNWDVSVVGWDVIISSSGPRIIEGNANPEVQLMQVHYPLLNNPQFLEFLSNNDIRGL